jgi:hypothetical protein
MKRFTLVLFAILVLAASFFQIRLTSAQEQTANELLRVIDTDTNEKLQRIASKLDSTDSTTKRFGELFDSPSGKIAIAGMLNSIRGQARNRAKDEAIEMFMDHHFSKDGSGKYVVREPSKVALKRWVDQAGRLGADANKMRAVMNEIASKMDASTEVGGLFQRLLRDPQAPVAIMIQEMNGGDVVMRFISDALGRILVDQGNGVFTIVESRRAEAEKLVDSFDIATKISKRLHRELPTLALDYTTEDEQHQKLVRYLKKPTTALIASLELAENASSATDAVNKLHEHFEQASTDTAKGLQIESDGAWESLDGIFDRVDRAESVLSRVKERLSEVAEILSKDDELTARFAAQLNAELAAAKIAAELPYADADAGEEFRGLISEVLVDAGGKFSVHEDHVDSLIGKSRELLAVCRKIRRYGNEIDSVLEQVADQTFVQELGDAGRYTILSEVRQFAERHQADPVELMREHLLVASEGDTLKVKVDQREIVRKLVAQAEKVQAEESNDDF